MAKYRIVGPFGETYEVTAPDGASEQDIISYVQKNAVQSDFAERAAKMSPEELSDIRSSAKSDPFGDYLRNEAQRPQASIKANLSKREAQLQLMAAKEKARRLEAAKKGAPQKEHAAPRPPSAQSASSNKEQSQPPHTEPSQGQQPQTQPQSRGVCTVVKIHPDGFVDLQLSSGEVIERVEQSWLERLGRAPPEGVPPPSASASRPSTAASERPPTAASRASSRPPTASLSLSQANAAAASTANVPPAASKPPGTANSLSMRELAAVVNLDETLAGMGRRGGRGNIGAQRAALSDMSSLLSWQ